jgi:antitoxin (DNA-binding transcriptional repressor) of toxin-antitoxin stability system
MKVDTVREVQHNLAKVLHEVQAGHVVEIVRRKQTVARLVPTGVGLGVPASSDWDDHQARMSSIWRGVVLEGVDEVLDDMRGVR